MIRENRTVIPLRIVAERTPVTPEVRPSTGRKKQIKEGLLTSPRRIEPKFSEYIFRSSVLQNYSGRHCHKTAPM